MCCADAGRGPRQPPTQGRQSAKTGRGPVQRAKRGGPVECRARGVVHKHENPRPPDRQGRKGGRRPELHRGPRMLQVIFSFFPEGRESFALMSRCRADPPPTTGAQRQGPRSNSGRGEGLQASAALMGLRRPRHFENTCQDNPRPPDRGENSRSGPAFCALPLGAAQWVAGTPLLRPIE